MKFTVQLLVCIFSVSFLSVGMEAPEKNLADQLEKKCSVSPQISRKRANSTLLEPDEALSNLFYAIKEKRAKQQYEMRRKIQSGDLIVYRIGVKPEDFEGIYKLDATIKAIIFNPHQQGLATVDLLVMVDKEQALIANPIVKTYMRLLKYENINI